MEGAFEPPLEWLGNASVILPGSATAVAVPLETHRPEYGMERALGRVRSLKGNTDGDKPLAETLQQGDLCRPSYALFH
jgi:hypothetical protein